MEKSSVYVLIQYYEPSSIRIKKAPRETLVNDSITFYPNDLYELDQSTTVIAAQRQEDALHLFLPIISMGTGDDAGVTVQSSAVAQANIVTK